MTDRVVVVTGATSGIGLVAARELARLGGTVAVVGRESGKVSSTVRDLKAQTGNERITGFVADLALQSEVRRLAGELRSSFAHIHVLVNNAGAVYSRRLVTSEGMEQTWALNVVAPFLLTQLLVSRLTESAPSRVVNVASAAHRGARLDFDNVQGEHGYRGFRAYSRSKLALVLLTYAFAEQLAGRHVTVNALHPGFVSTRFGRNNPGGVGATIGFFAYLFGIRPDSGARTTIFLASDPALADTTGKYFSRRRVVASSPESYNTVERERLWNVLTAQTGVPVDSLTRVR